MSNHAFTTDRVQTNTHETNLSADVLVIGGSIAGAWAAYSAHVAGAKVVLVDKGYVGTAGVVAAATGGASHAVPNDPEQRQKIIYQRHKEALGLDDPVFIERVYDESYAVGKQLEALGFAPQQNGGGPSLTGFPGAYSLQFFRKLLLKSGVQILDNSPALELLTHEGVVSGASGVNRQTGRTWSVRARAVILATGGNAFRSGAMGTNGNTGDGYLMAAEVGAEFVGMEFSGHYGIAPLNSACTKGFWYGSATFYDAEGRELGVNGWGAVPNVARAIIETGRAYATITKINPLVQRGGPAANAFFVYCQRVGIDPYQEKFPIELLYEGTVRAVGGLVINETAVKGVPGLFAAGDVTDKTKITGAAMSGAGPAIAWCLASGSWSGKGAAAFAATRSQDFLQAPLAAAGRVGLRPKKEPRPESAEFFTREVQDEILPIEKNVFRRVSGVNTSLSKLDNLWQSAGDSLADFSSGRSTLKAREAASLVASSRWIYYSSLQRQETRGLHRFHDYPELDPNQLAHVITGGLDQVWARH